MTIQHTALLPASQPKSEGLFGWLPGSGIMHKVIEKTKVAL